MSALDELARAYDALAPDYDRQMAGDAWMRRVLWAHYLGVFRPGQHVLDVGCGTGIDALFLAQRGIRVTGVDASPGMIARFEEKARAAGLAHQVEPRVLDFAALDAWPAGAFDGIVSAFAGLNTAPSLGPFAATAARLLRPEGRLVAHLLNRWSLWEWLGLLGRGDWRGARALGRRRERRFAIGGQTVRHFPSTPDEAAQSFRAAGFRLRRAYGLGILRPPHTVRRFPPPVVDALDRLESGLRGHPRLVGRGRLFVLDLERQADEGRTRPATNRG